MSHSIEDVCIKLGLPNEIAISYKNNGIKLLYDWQIECIFNNTLNNHKPRHILDNIVYSAPTSGGKTLVAELLLLHSLISRKRKVIFVLPFIALVQEKEVYFNKILKRYNKTLFKEKKLKVRAIYGDNNKYKVKKDSIFICTIEKANKIINEIVQQGYGESIGCIAIDEMHVLGESFNGYLLEIIISKLLYLNDKLKAKSPDLQHIQIIAMSATISNISDISNWIKGHLYISNYRPVPLMEYIKSGNIIYDKQGNISNELPVNSKDSIDSNDIFLLSHKALLRGQQILLFCPTKNDCILTLEIFMNCYIKYNDKSLLLTHNHTADFKNIQENRQQIKLQLLSVSKKNPNALLQKSIEYGISIHTASLTQAERNIIENGYRSGDISILVCTSTLAAGVNLPAGCVIIKSMSLGKDPLNIVTYKQMSGRAGRKNQALVGISILVVTSSEKNKALELINQVLPNISSQLDPQNDNGNGILKSLIDIFGINICLNLSECLEFISYTLLFNQLDNIKQIQLKNYIKSCYDFLLNSKIILINNNNNYTLTKFGHAIIKCNINPDEGIAMYDILLNITNGINVENNLHLIYLCIPYSNNYISILPNYSYLYNYYEKNKNTSTLSSLFESNNIDISIICKWIHSPPSSNIINICHNTYKYNYLLSNFLINQNINITKIQIKHLLFCKRLYNSLIINRLIENISIYTIAHEFNVKNEQIESLLTSLRMTAQRVQRFCTELGWLSLSRMIHNFISMYINRNISDEFVTLMECNLINKSIAELLISYNIKNFQDLCLVDPIELTHKLMLCNSFEPTTTPPIENKGLKNVKIDVSISNFSVTIPNDQSEMIAESGKYMENKNQIKRGRDDKFDNVYNWVINLLNTSKCYCEEKENQANEDTAFIAESLQKLTLSKLTNDDIDISDQSSNNELDNLNDLSDSMSSEVLSEIDSMNGKGMDEWDPIDEGDIDSIEISNINDDDPINNIDLLESMNITKKENHIDIICNDLDRENTEDLLELEVYTQREFSQVSDQVNNKENQVNYNCNPIRSKPLRDLFSSPPAKLVRIDNGYDFKDEVVAQNSIIDSIDNGHDISDDILLAALEAYENLEQKNKIDNHIDDFSNIDNNDSVTTYKNNIIDCQVNNNDYMQNMTSPPCKVQKKHQSPYLTPYTASKMKSPGKYLYLPSIISINEIFYEEMTRVMDVLIPSNAFGYRHLSISSHCQQFLNKVSKCSMISFEILYRRIPIHKRESYNDVSVRWGNVLAWACPVSSSSRFGGVSSANEIEIDYSGQRTMLYEPHVISGIGINFGDEFGYYIPLPCSLPTILPFKSSNDYIDVNDCGIDRLPINCKKLICSFVWFPKVFNRCPYLRHCYLLSTNQSSNFSTIQNDYAHLSNSSNPLLYVSKRWAIISRQVLLNEWQKGNAVEWALVNQIMSNEAVSKVTIDCQNKLVGLRERDIISKGPLNDPAIAINLLKLCSNSKIIKSLSQLVIPNDIVNSSNNSDSVCRRVVYRSIAIMRAMGRIEIELSNFPKIKELYKNIEMPLLYSLVDSQYNGLPINTSFYTSFKFDIIDRLKVIEGFFRRFISKKFNPNSIKDFNTLKDKIVQLNNFKVISDNANRKSIEENGDHPFMLLIKEYKSLQRIQPMVSSILSNRFQDRVKCVYNSIGTETGRLILSSPALQHVPHECVYKSIYRLSLHDEISIIPEPQIWIESINKKILNGHVELIHLLNKNVNNSNIIFNNQIGRLIYITRIPFYKSRKHGIENYRTFCLTNNDTTFCNDSISRINYIVKVFIDESNKSDSIYNDCLQVIVEIDNQLLIYPIRLISRVSTAIQPNELELEIFNLLSNNSKSKVNNNRINQYENISCKLNPRDGFEASEGYILISADYSQIELRLLAHLSRDSNLLVAFTLDINTSDRLDIFRNIASQWLNKRYVDISDKERNQVKQICYAIIYGASINFIVEKTSLSFEDSKRLYTSFLNKYKSITMFISEIKKLCKSNGYVETLLGRKRYLSDISSLDKKKRNHAERQAVNTVCQGSAADLIKLAMINIHHRLEEVYRYKNSSNINKHFRYVHRVPGGGLYRRLDDVRLVLQIHDELLYEVPIEDVNEVSCIVKECMENAIELLVPLEVKIEIGKRWGSMIPLDEYQDQHSNNQENKNYIYSNNINNSEVNVNDNINNQQSNLNINRNIFRNFTDQI